MHPRDVFLVSYTGFYTGSVQKTFPGFRLWWVLWGVFAGFPHKGCFWGCLHL